MSNGTGEQAITVLGQTNFRGQARPFGIYEDDRRRHIYVVGKTGVGKTTFIENMVAQDIVEGRGVCLVDPHGDAVESLLNAVPPSRINDVVYFDPSDVDYPVAFNVLEAMDPSYKYLVASGLVSSLKKIWADSWGPRLEYILRNTILALLDYPSSTILGILRMLSDKTYRTKVVARIQDPVVKAFWTNEFAQYNERFRSEAISPIQNKVGQLLSSAIIRNIMAQPKSTIDMKDIMDNGKILLINVSKGKIGEDNSALLGAMIINRLQLAAMDRASIPEEQRRDFYLYVDEFQNFATESFADILSEARKYRLNLVVAHQYITQMEEEVSDAVFGNVGTMVVFRVGAPDAELLEKEFAPNFTETDLVNLDKYQAYIKLMINGITSKPFSMKTLPPTAEHFNKAEIVRTVSRERFGRSRAIIEDKIKRWSGATLAEKGEEERARDGQPGRWLPRRAGEGDRGENQPYREPRRDTRPPPAHRGEIRDRQPLSSQRRQPVQATEDVVPKLPAREIMSLAGALMAHAKQPVAHPDGRAARPLTTMHDAICSRCGKATKVPFQPDPEKPVYCQACLALVRAAKRQLIPSPAAKAPASGAFVGPKPPAFTT